MMPLYLLLGVLVLLVLTRPLVVLAHELGHAVPALLLTTEPVTVYVGSYGDPRRCGRVRLGRLVVWIRGSLFWRAGLCQAATHGLSGRGQACFLLGGPVASCLLGVLGGYTVFAWDLHGALKLYTTVFLLAAFTDLWTNLVPRAVPVRDYPGGWLYSDGYLLQALWYRRRRFATEHAQALAHYHRQEFRPAARLLERFLAHHLASAEIFRLAVSARLHLREYAPALALHQAFAAAHPLSADDYATAGLLKGRLGRANESLDDYDACLALEPHHLAALHNKGYTLGLLGRFAEAIGVFDQTLALDPAHAHAYSNRGLAQLKLGRDAPGLADVHHALALDPGNAYAHRNLGIYCLDRQQYTAAATHFAQAHALDEDTHLLAELMAQAAQPLRYLA